VVDTVFSQIVVCLHFGGRGSMDVWK